MRLRVVVRWSRRRRVACYGLGMAWGRAAVVLALVVAGCAAPASRTTSELAAEIEAYERAEPEASEEKIKALFAKLDAEIAVLRAEELAEPAEERAAITARREALVAERRELQAAYLRARVARLGSAAEDTLKSMGEKLGQELEEAGRAIRESLREAEDVE